MTIEIRPVAGSFAAEVLGADLAANDDATFAAVRRALFDHGVIVIRGQDLPPEAQVAFSRRFGTVEGRRPSASDKVLMKGLPEITLLSNRREKGALIGNADAGRYWHSDQSFQEKPNLATLVYAVEIPAEGGDTLFADLVGAYETLPVAMRDRIEGRRAAHTFAKHYRAIMAQGSTRPPLTPEQVANLKEMWHPIVRTLPETGRKALFINPGHTARIEGMDEDESEALLEELFAHCLRPDNIYCHKWRLKDAVFWDNRAVMHKAETYDMARYTRHMHRTSIHGDRPV